MHSISHWQRCKTRVYFIASPSLFYLHTEHIIQKVALDSDEVGAKTGVRNTNNLKYANDILLAENKKGLEQRLRKLKEESAKARLQLNTEKTKIMATEEFARLGSDC